MVGTLQTRSLVAVSQFDVFCARTPGPDATRALAEKASALLTDGDLLVLTGDLGAGKTCFTQGLGVGLGIHARITSPTFTLVATHEGRLRLNHLDVYRLDGPADTIDLDLPDLLEDGVTVIEWGERIASVLPTDRLLIEFSYLDIDDQDQNGDPDAEEDWAVIDDRRQLRFELGGTWRARRADLEAAVASWAVPC